MKYVSDIYTGDSYEVSHRSLLTGLFDIYTYAVSDTESDNVELFDFDTLPRVFGLDDDFIFSTTAFELKVRDLITSATFTYDKPSWILGDVKNYREYVDNSFRKVNILDDKCFYWQDEALHDRRCLLDYIWCLDFDTYTMKLGWNIIQYSISNKIKFQQLLSKWRLLCSI